MYSLEGDLDLTSIGGGGVAVRTGLGIGAGAGSGLQALQSSSRSETDIWWARCTKLAAQNYKQDPEASRKLPSYAKQATQRL